MRLIPAYVTIWSIPALTLTVAERILPKLSFSLKTWLKDHLLEANRLKSEFWQSWFFLEAGREKSVPCLPPGFWWLLQPSVSLACSCVPPITCACPHTGPSPSPLHILPKWLRCVWPPAPCCSCSVTSGSLWPTDCSTPGSSVLHYLPEFAQTHIHWVISLLY